MKSLFVKTLPLCLCLFFTTAQAQMSSPRPQYRSEASDTSYKETDEDAPKHLHQTVTIIKKKKLMPDGSYQTEQAYIHHRKDKGGNMVADTTSEAGATAAADSTPPVAQEQETSQMNLVIPTDNDGGARPNNMYLLYAGIGLIGLALLLALFLLIAGRDKKRSPAISMLGGACATTGLALLLAYSICLSGFIAGLIVLLLAAVSGAAVLTNDANERPNPMWLVGSNILLTIAGIVIIALSAFGH